MSAKSDRELIQETHDAVVRLENSWNGGPGHWASCVQAKEQRGDHEQRIRGLETASAERRGGRQATVAFWGVIVIIVGWAISVMKAHL